MALDSAILQHPKVWEASGHLAGFTDPLVDCRACGQRFRADHLQELPCPRKPSRHPGEFADCDLTPARDFNLMFETTVGPVQDSGSVAYLRPETAQGIFINFKNVLQVARKKPPFGIAQVGKSFRNEITPGNFIFRTREFEQMEMEFFVPPERGAALVRATGSRPAATGTRRSGCGPTTSACASTRPTSSATTPAGRPTSSTSSPSAGPSWRASPTAATSTSRQHARHSGEKLEYFDQGIGRALRPARHRAGGRRRPRDARLPRRRLRRGGGRRRDAHRPQAPPAARAHQGRGAAARAQGRPARARPRGLRRRARRRAGRVRRGRGRSASATAARTRSARRGA